MKQKDIILIIVLAFISGVISFTISGVLFGRSSERTQKIEVVDAITADFPLPSSKYFNAESVNLTQLIQIGDYENPNPFSGSQ